MKKLLIITTINDRSLPLFFTKELRDKLDIDVCLVSESVSHIRKMMEATRFDFIYLRDPFTDPRLPLREVRQKCTAIMQGRGKGYMVDDIKTESDIFFEDKWNQYGVFADLMPSTRIMRKDDRALEGMIFKKRISSRAQGIVFDGRKIEKGFSGFIVQERLSIKKEYRVFVIFGKVWDIVEMKSSKVENQKVKVLRKLRISGRLLRFSNEVAGRMDFDFVGLDIAEMPDGRLFLLEANRSCLFNGFYRLTGVNLAEAFAQELLGKR